MSQVAKGKQQTRTVKVGDIFYSKSGIRIEVLKVKSSMCITVKNEYGVVFDCQKSALLGGRVSGLKKIHSNTNQIELMDDEKFINGAFGKYSVTKSGDVYSFFGGFRKKLEPGMNVSQRYHAGKVGYLSVCLNGQAYRIHTLVAHTFLGDQPKGSHVDHINGNKHDNRVENLRYVSPKENVDNYYKLENSSERIANYWLLGRYDQAALASYALGYIVDITKNKIKHMPEECEVRLGVSKELLLSLPTEKYYQDSIKAVDYHEKEEVCDLDLSIISDFIKYSNV